MPLLVANCPRCGAKEHTFDVLSFTAVDLKHGWQEWYETFCRCRACKRTTIFVLSQSLQSDPEMFRRRGLMNHDDSLNNYCEIISFINYSDLGSVDPPEHLPDEVKTAFEEASRSHTIGCWNAAGCMFRTCIDLATRNLLPIEETSGLNQYTRRNLAPRLTWLFENGILPSNLSDLSSCVREDGNDAAHMASLGKEDAEDLLDFTVALLERIYTEPKKVEIALERRHERRVR